MKIFLSYGHDSNAPLIEKIKEYLSKDAEGNLKHEVWIDTSEIKAGKDWREKITKGVLESDVVIAGLSQHSTRIPGVCRDEISISIGVKGGNIKTILLEPSDVVAPPAMISHIQWLDMSDWKEHENEGFDSEYFQEKFRQIAEMIETPENERFNGEITQLKEALEPISSISRIRALTEKEMYGRKWLYEKIEDWDKNSTQRLFWIVAGPGFGKSMFAANLQEQYNARIPAIQFVEWGKPDHSNPCRILKNLAFQLAVRYPEYRAFVLQQPDVINKKLNEKNEDELFDLLFCESTWMKIDGGQENVWVLIDALDEANDEYGNRIAQTLARHMDRMPQWMRFILTSRDDSKVRLPLQKYHPQVFDLEEYVKEKNSEDLLLYVRGELEKFNPTEEQVKLIVDKSQGVFLYLSLCVEGIRKREYSLDHLDKLPNGLNGYYYEFFTRQFGNDIERYKKEIAPVLQLMVASPAIMTLPFVQYVLGIVSEIEFYTTIDNLEHVTRFIKNSYFDRMKNVNVPLPDKITFFHNSVENWITNRVASGPFYVSKTDGIKCLAEKFSLWTMDTSKQNDHNWGTYGYGLQVLGEAKMVLSKKTSYEKLGVLMDSMRYYGGLGGFTKESNIGRQSAVAYCKSLLIDGKEEDFLSFILALFEYVKDQFMEIDGTEFVPTKMFNAARDAGTVGSILKFLFEKEILCSEDTFAIVLRVLRVLVYYDSCLCDPFDHLPSLAFEDLQDLSTIELSRLADELSRKMPSIERLSPLHRLIPEIVEENFNRITALYYKALSERYPEKYPNSERYIMREISYQIGACTIRACE